MQKTLAMLTGTIAVSMLLYTVGVVSFPSKSWVPMAMIPFAGLIGGVCLSLFVFIILTGGNFKNNVFGKLISNPRMMLSIGMVVGIGVISLVIVMPLLTSHFLMGKSLRA
jgi:hypothetical protein